MMTFSKVSSALALVMVIACADAGSGNTPGDGQDSVGADGGAIAPPADGGIAIAPDNLIDDLDDGDGSIAEVNGRIGAWYTYNDETATGEQTPDPAGDFAPTAGGTSQIGFMARTAGSGFTEWGAGMGLDLNNPGDAKGVWDASSFTGIAFYAAGDVPIRVAVVVQAVVPEADGGTCKPGTAEGEECDDAHGQTVVLDNAWRQYLVPFDQITQEGWGRPAAFDATTLTGVQFQIPTGASFDIAIDEIGFY